MFEVTGEDVAALDDTKLRTLVEKLCAAELVMAGLPLSAVTAGGDQNAPDGGVDVRVSLAPGSGPTNFIPRPETVFQVKKPDMPPTEIRKEMCPKGSLRPVIRELARKQGAYIIVSSGASTSDSRLQERHQAMREACASVPGLPEVSVDFYDRERLARWVGQYPGVAAWVREQSGKTMSGWRGYGNWSKGSGSKYLFDAKTRLYYSRNGQELTVETGINRIRGVLAKPGGVVRLIGLSGVGKTRLVEALFDQDVGEHALNTALVVYADLAADPTPPPLELLRYCIRTSRAIIMIADNCRPDIHGGLAKELGSVSKAPPISLLTVEYDVGDDEPEGTEVFRLDAASDDLIEKLLEAVAPQLSPVDRRRIAEFSGGNARMARAVAGTAQKRGSFAQLSDADLVRRLFWQRHSEDETLLRVGEVCSLVYSFDGETTEGADAELPILARLAGISVDEFYFQVQELKSRELVQQRGKWRALLPHALANRLAKQALERILPDSLRSGLIDPAPPRLLQSFAHRLGFLHECRQAQEIAETWLSAGGRLGRVESLSSRQGVTLLRNIAPVSPEKTLAAIEGAAATPQWAEIVAVRNTERYSLGELLASLAFDAGLFDRAVGLLAHFVIVEPADKRRKSLHDVFATLFQMFLSGTHASVQQRLHCVDRLLTAEDGRSRDVGLAALDRMFKSSGLMTFRDFQFGARPRDYGWSPKTDAEVAGWYRAVLDFVLERITSGSPLADRLFPMVAAHFRELWFVRGGISADLGKVAEKISQCGNWWEGWVAVRRMLKQDATGMPVAILKRLRGIEVSLRPQNLVDQAEAYVLPLRWDIGDGEPTGDKDDPSAGYRKADGKIKALGRQIALCFKSLQKILPDLMQGEESGSQWSFGIGLAQGAADPEDMWRMLTGSFALVSGQRNTGILKGYLFGMSHRDSGMAAKFLDAAVNDPTLGPVFPELQGAVEIDEDGVRRLRDSLRRALAPVDSYKNIISTMMIKSSPAIFQKFLLDLSAYSGGTKIAIYILNISLYYMQEKRIVIPTEFISCGRKLLLCYNLNSIIRKGDEYSAVEILKMCLSAPEAELFARKICAKVSELIFNFKWLDIEQIISELVKAVPQIALDAFILPDAGEIFGLVSHGF